MKTAFLSSARSCSAEIKFNCMHTNFIATSYFHLWKKKKSDSNLCEHAFLLKKFLFVLIRGRSRSYDFSPKNPTIFNAGSDGKVISW